MLQLSGDNLYLTGVIGECFGGVSTPEFARLLAKTAGRKLTIHIDSVGGDALTGIAIHSAMRLHTPRPNVFIASVAASAASLIAIAGERVTIANGAMIMIHGASLQSNGNAADHKRSIASIDAVDRSMAEMYAARAGGTTEEWLDRLARETWFTAKDAVAIGLADEVQGEARRPAALALASFRNPPAEIRALMENSMTEEEKIRAAVQADRARRAAILAAPEAKGRQALAEHFANATDLPAEAAVAALAAAPVANASNGVDGDLARRRADAAALAMPIAKPNSTRRPASWSSIGG